MAPGEEGHDAVAWVRFILAYTDAELVHTLWRVLAERLRRRV